MNLPRPSFGDVVLVREYFTTPALDEVADTTRFLTTFAALSDPPFTCTCLIAALPTKDASLTYRKAVDVLQTSDPAVLVVAVTLLEVALSITGADVQMWQDLSADDPVAIRAAAAAVIAATEAVAALNNTTAGAVLEGLIT